MWRVKAVFRGILVTVLLPVFAVGLVAGILVATLRGGFRGGAVAVVSLVNSLVPKA